MLLGVLRNVLSHAPACLWCLLACVDEQVDGDEPEDVEGDDNEESEGGFVVGDGYLSEDEGLRDDDEDDQQMMPAGGGSSSLCTFSGNRHAACTLT